MQPFEKPWNIFRWKTKHVQDLDADNNQVIMREKKDLNKFRNILCSQYRGQFSPHWYTDLTQFLPESQQDCLHIQQDNSKIYIEKQRKQNSGRKKKSWKTKIKWEEFVHSISIFTLLHDEVLPKGQTLKSTEWKRIQN